MLFKYLHTNDHCEKWLFTSPLTSTPGLTVPDALNWLVLNESVNAGVNLAVRLGQSVEKVPNHSAWNPPQSWVLLERLRPRFRFWPDHHSQRVNAV